MAETLAVLKDTPIPTLLILGGIALLVLSVATNVAGKLPVARDRQKWAGIAGLILVAVGVFLHLYKPEIPASPTPTPFPSATTASLATMAAPTPTEIAPTSAPTASPRA